LAGLDHEAFTEVCEGFPVNLNKENKVKFSISTASRSHLKTSRAACLAAALLLGAATIHAQSAPATGAAAATPGKVAVINARQAIVSTAEGKQASAELQSQFAPRTGELENIGKQISALRQRLESGASTLSDDEKTRLQRQIDTLTRQGQRKQDEYQEDVNAAQADVIDRIGRKMVDIIERYGRENGYVAVLDSSAQGSPLLYFSNTIDITQDIVRLFDQQYPVKAGAAATTPGGKPAGTKPAASTAQPPATKPTASNSQPPKP
jgi:outer membrane protein